MNSKLTIASIAAQIWYLQNKAAINKPDVEAPDVNTLTKEFVTAILDALGGVAVFGRGSGRTDIVRSKVEGCDPEAVAAMTFFHENKYSIVNTLQELANEYSRGYIERFITDNAKLQEYPVSSIKNAFGFMVKSHEVISTKTDMVYRFEICRLIAFTLIWEVVSAIEAYYMDNYNNQDMVFPNKDKQGVSQVNSKHKATIEGVNAYLNYLKHRKNPLHPKLQEPDVSSSSQNMANIIAESLGGASLYGWGYVESPVFRRTFHVDKKRTAVLLAFFFDNKDNITSLIHEMAGRDYNGHLGYLLDSMFGFTTTPSDAVTEVFSHLVESTDIPTEDGTNALFQYNFYGLILSTVFWELLKYLEDDYTEHYSL